MNHVLALRTCLANLSLTRAEPLLSCLVRSTEYSYFVRTALPADCVAPSRQTGRREATEWESTWLSKQAPRAQAVAQHKQAPWSVSIPLLAYLATKTAMWFVVFKRNCLASSGTAGAMAASHSHYRY